MPKNKRWKNKQRLDSVLNQLGNAQRIAGETGLEYEGVHQDYFDAFSGIVQIIELVKEQVVVLRDKI